MSDETRRHPPPAPPHLSEERCNDILLGLAPRDVADEAGRHVAVCPRCEALLQRLSAEFEALRSRPVPKRDAAGIWRHPDTTSAAGDALRQGAGVERAAFPRRRRRLWTWGLSAAAVLVAVVLSWPMRSARDAAPGGDDRSYWIPVESQVLRTRSTVGAADSSFRAGLQAYVQQDADGAAALLQQSRVEEGWDDLRRVYLASALVNASRQDVALAVLEDLDVSTLPQPWRDRATWVRFLALRASGRLAESAALLPGLADSDSDIGRRARQELRRQHRR